MEKNNVCNCSSCPSGKKCATTVELPQIKLPPNAPKSIRIGLAGNPNSGKTTLFNCITGSHQKVGNYPGVTVEKKVGTRVFRDVNFTVYDLPGVYSLTAYSLDEVVTRDFIIDEKPDVIINVIDSTNIERNLFLCLQFQELGIPVVGALNMTDEAQSMGIEINATALSELLGVKMVKVCAKNNVGIETLLSTTIQESVACAFPGRGVTYGNEMESEINILVSELKSDSSFAKKYPVRWAAIKLLEKDANAQAKLEEHLNRVKIKQIVSQCISRIEQHFGRDSEIVMTEQRYAYVHGAVSETVVERGTERFPLTAIIDKVLLNRILGLPFFLFILWAIFQATFKIGAFPMRWLEHLFGFLGAAATTVLPTGFAQSLVVDGIIAGVGGVLSFVPLIIILFVFISILEDTGYMGRAAFIMDKFLHVFGLHGQSFLPMIIGFGCSVPAMMSSRTLKNPRDRIITILITPFMSCGAKLPVYILLAGAFFPKTAGNVVLSIYIIGIVLALLSSLLFRRTMLKGEATPFVMELPPYRMPTIHGILWHVWDKTSQYLKKAGTVLLAASILIWILVSFPKPSFDKAKYDDLASKYRNEHIDKGSNERIESEVSLYISKVKEDEVLENSFAGQIGRFIEPAVKPLGFDWKIGISAITGFAAKEAVVSTLGILYKTGNEENVRSATLRDALRADSMFNPLVAYVLMLFTLIVTPCFATLSMIRAEIGWKWLVFSIGYTLVLAWLLCGTVYQIGLRL